jgi:hypothetical protein
MPHHILRVLSILFVSALPGVAGQAQQNPPDAPSATSDQTQGNDHVVEGTVISTTAHTLVVRSDDNRYHLFTYDARTVPKEAVKAGVRVRVNGSAPDSQGTQVAENVAVIHPGAAAANGSEAQAAQPPASVNKVSKEIESEARRWHVGGRVGFGLSPELFMFGPQMQVGPFFSQHLLFRPDLEFGFGELTDMYAVNAEAAYLFNSAMFHRQWNPYFGMGPSFNFIHQSASNGTTSFSDFDYNTGFNVFVGTQKHKTFLEVKTALWAPKTPVFRVFVGYNF